MLKFDKYCRKYGVSPYGLSDYKGNCWWILDWQATEIRYALPAHFFKYTSNSVLVCHNQTKENIEAIYNSIPYKFLGVPPPSVAKPSFKGLSFIIDSSKSDGYTTTVANCAYFNNLFDALKHVNDKGDNLYVSLGVEDCFFVNALDFDNIDEEQLKDVLYYLDYVGLKYALYESSPKHYWIILDLVTWSTILYDTRFYEDIPGVDKEYLRLCSSFRGVRLRGLSGNTTIKLLKSNVESPLVRSYLNHFNQHWVEQFYAKLL